MEVTLRGPHPAENHAHAMTGVCRRAFKNPRSSAGIVWVPGFRSSRREWTTRCRGRQKKSLPTLRMNHVQEFHCPDYGRRDAGPGWQCAGCWHEDRHIRRQRQRGVELLHYDYACVGFGDYNGTRGRSTRMPRVVVRCSKNAPYQIALNAGTTAGATLAPATACRSGGETLEYNLYSDRPACDDLGQQRWRHGLGYGHRRRSRQSPTRSPTLCTANLPNNAANQAAAVGAYSDLITATITY